MASAPEPFLQAIAAYRDLIVGVKCIFCWYWLADLCAAEKIDFVLGHALYMKAIHGCKEKNDKIDAYKIASLLRGNEPAQKYVSRLARKHDKAKALTILAHRLGRAVYHMLRRGEAFDNQRFLTTV